MVLIELSPLAAELVLQALRPIVYESSDIEDSGTSLEAINIDDHNMRTTREGLLPLQYVFIRLVYRTFILKGHRLRIHATR